ncbi:MAG: L-2-amino-thiazoline-4-carboxylic acid hydrolase [Pseudomonadota bacterium]
MSGMGILERRRLEAMLLKPVYERAKARYGEAEAKTLIGESVSNAAIEHGKGFAEALGKTPDFKDFLDIMPLWTQDGALEIEVLEADESKLEFNVRRRRCSEMYEQMGLGDIGHLLSCNRDGDFCVGDNPDMELTRTQTIMTGASHCDFRYRMKSKAE